MSLEQISFNIILHAGNARSFTMEALQKAKIGEIIEAKEKLAEARKSIYESHSMQTNLIQGEAKGEKQEVSILLIHAQDHLMTTMSMLDMADYLVDLYEKRDGGK